MDKDVRSAIERATQRARKLLEEDYIEQLEGTYDVLRDGKLPENGARHLDVRGRFQREKIVAAVEHKKASGMTAREAALDYLRDAAFTTLNRFVALKMLEARDLVQPCISKGEQSGGYKEFGMLAPALNTLPGSDGYRLFLECIFDELSTEIKVLFDRRDVASVLWPRRQTVERLLEILNDPALSTVWIADETIGWVYQYFNYSEERREMRESQAPQSSRELAVRNQFFTPRYVVDFLVHNTLAALWVEMSRGESVLNATPLLVPRTVATPRPMKDPREIRVLDPACGSGHFLLSAFEVFTTIYREAWSLPNAQTCAATGRTLHQDYPSLPEFEREIPRLILQHNLFGIDIDARCSQIAALALWMRAQRSWNDQNVSRQLRPSIARTNIVIAEPMPAGPDTRDAFIRELEPKLARVAAALFQRLDLAGEAGSLLDVHGWFRAEVREALGEFGELFSRTDEERWREAETKLIDSLRVFATEATVKRQWRRSLFADDAARGLAFVDVTRETFDVVLMNPPFGDPTARSRSACGPELAIAANDIGGAFVLAAKRRWAPHGCIGVLSSTALWFKPTVTVWRKETLLADGYGVRAAAHLGGDVLDGATVNASATVIDGLAQGDSAYFIRLILVGDKYGRLRTAVEAIQANREDELVYHVSPGEFSQFRGAPLAYWISKGLRSKLASFPPLEGNGAEVRRGVEPPGDFRFVSAWWEVPLENIGLGKNWVPFAKSSEYSPLWDDLTWVISWANEGHEVWSLPRAERAGGAEYARLYFGRPGVTYPARSVLGFNPRAFPTSAAFGHMGAVAFPIEVDARVLLGYLASRPLEYVLSFSNGSLQGKKGSYPNHYEVGQIKDLPWPKWQHKSLSLLLRNGDAIATAAMRLQAEDETTHQYAGRPALRGQDTVREVVEGSVRRRASLMTEIRRARDELDQVVAMELGFDAHDIEEMNREFTRCERPTAGPWSPSFGEISDDALREEAERLASELFGFAIGRFDIRPALRGTAPPDRASAFESLPSGAPALLREVPDDYPIALPRDGALLVDPGSERDVGRAVASVASALWGDRSSRMEQELASLLGFGDLDSYYSATSQEGFFGRHLTHYAKSRRTAPVYWSLGTPSGRYTVFLHYPRLRRDTLLDLVQDHAQPKLAHEVRLFDELQREAEASPTAGQRKALAAQESLVGDLRAFIEELKRVVPLWKPDLDDGIIINFAPLWRLVPQHKAWQKDLKATWDALCNHEYDWAHLAMHLWPERVVPRCAEDRSLAIAHGLEDVFWIEESGGRWKARPKPMLSVDTLVKERTSPAVKAALKSLLEAPAPAGTTRAAPKKAAAVRRKAKEAES